MRRSLLQSAAACSAILVGGIGRMCGQNAVPIGVEATQENTAWTFSYRNQKVLVYAFAPQKFKPYVKELYTFKGDNILRDAPHDHLHHHGLMYAIKVNGLNFWEEVSGNGVEKIVQTSSPTIGSSSDRPQAMLSQYIHWVTPQDAFLPDSAAVALLIEHRTLTVLLDPAQQEVALEWKSEFEVGGKTNTISLSGATYHGLGVRFRQDFDPLAIHSLAGTRPDLENNRQDISAVDWGAVSFDAPGHPATLVMAGHPGNARERTTFFSMLTPFPYLSATQALNKEPLVYHTGDKFELRYLILVYPTVVPADAITKRVQSWKETERSQHVSR